MPVARRGQRHRPHYPSAKEVDHDYVREYAEIAVGTRLDGAPGARIVPAACGRTSADAGKGEGRRHRAPNQGAETTA